MDPARKAPEVELRPELRRLALDLARLDRAEREQVIALARSGSDLPTVPWNEFWKLKGLLHLGGNAVEDGRAGSDD